MTSALNEDGTVRGRAGAAYQDAEEFIDNYDKDRALVFGSFAFDLSDTTTLTVGAHYDDYKSTVQVDLPGIVGVGFDRFAAGYISGRR